MRVVACLTLMVLSGCVTELLNETSDTTRNITCAVLDERAVPSVVVHVYGAVPEVFESAMDTLAADTGRSRASMSLVKGSMPADVTTWSTTAVRLDGNIVHLHLLVLEDQEEVVRLISPGIVGLSAPGLEAGALATERSVTDMARIAALHGFGHALGVVNAGTPLNGTHTEGRESPMHHEASARSIMHVGWHKPGTMPQTNATYDHFSPAIIDDWQARSCP